MSQWTCTGCGKPIGNPVFTVCDDCWPRPQPPQDAEPCPGISPYSSTHHCPNCHRYQTLVEQVGALVDLAYVVIEQAREEGTCPVDWERFVEAVEDMRAATSHTPPPTTDRLSKEERAWVETTRFETLPEIARRILDVLDTHCPKPPEKPYTNCSECNAMTEPPTLCDIHRAQ